MKTKKVEKVITALKDRICHPLKKHIILKTLKLKTLLHVIPCCYGNQLIGECLVGKHDKSDTFSYYLLLILSSFKSDDGETYQEYTMGKNVSKF